MIRSKIRYLRLVKEEKEGRKLTLRVMSAETGLSIGAVQRALESDAGDMAISTFDVLCTYFNVSDLGEALEYRRNDTPNEPPA